jgi:hypothetical protein
MIANTSWRHAVQAALAAGLVIASTAACATLGEKVATVEADRVRLQGERRVVQGATAHVETHVIALADGSRIKEFVAPDGIVFAVSWSTRLKPRLESLLGAHAPRYAAAARQSLATPGIRRNVMLASDDLVVQASAHLNAHVGLAYLRSRVPEGVRIDDLR